MLGPALSARLRGRRRWHSEMAVRVRGRYATARRSRQETAMNQVGFDDILERPLVFADGRGEGFEADRPAAKFLDDRRQHRAIETVETRLIDVEPIEREMRRVDPDALIPAVSQAEPTASSRHRSFTSYSWLKYRFEHLCFPATLRISPGTS